MYQSCLATTQLVKHAVYLCLLQGHRILQGLDPFLGSIQGNSVAIKPPLHRPELLVDILVPCHQLRECVIYRRAHLLHHLHLIVDKLLVVLQGHLVDPRLLFNPIQLKALVSFDYQEV